MPLTVTRIDDVPRPTRNKKRSLEGTEEWIQLRAKLADGLKPYEAIYITFTPEQLKRMAIKTAGRILLKMTKDYIRKMRLEYDVWRYHSEGQEVVVVASRGLAKSAQPEMMAATGTGMSVPAGAPGARRVAAARKK